MGRTIRASCSSVCASSSDFAPDRVGHRAVPVPHICRCSAWIQRGVAGRTRPRIKEHYMTWNLPLTRSVLASFALQTFAETHRIEKSSRSSIWCVMPSRATSREQSRRSQPSRYFSHSPNDVRAARQEWTERAALPRRLRRARGHESLPALRERTRQSSIPVCEYRATPRPCRKREMAERLRSCNKQGVCTRLRTKLTRRKMKGP